MAITRITKGVIKPNENYDTHNIVSTGIVTTTGLDVNGNADISGNFSVGGVLTYEDVTNIDSVGIITARNGIFVDDSITHIGDTDTKIRFHANDTVSVETGGSQQVTIGANVNIISGELTIPDTIRHRNDANTKIRFPADDTFSVETAGSERLRISSGGSIGIGTDNPQQDIHILRSQLSRVRIESTSTTHNADVIFQNPDGLLGVVGYNATSDTINIDSRGGTNGITITRSGTEKARITSDGNVGIASTLPTQKLDVNGTVKATSFSGNLPAANITGTLPAISGANLTNLPAQATIANNADNRVITGGSGVNLNGEANLTYNGTKLSLTGNSASPIVEFVNTSGAENEGDVLKLRASGRGSGVDDTDILLITNNTDTRTFGVSNAGTVNTTGDIKMATGKNISSSGIVTATAFVSNTPLSHRNVIRNGHMQVIQRGTPLTVNANLARGRTCADGWEVSSDANGTAVFSTSKSTDTPNDFGSSLKLDVTTADTSIAADVGTRLLQRFEGQDLQAFKKGSSDALQFTLSFYVKSPKTGTHCIELLDIDNNRSVSATYTISAANTWQYVTNTFPADTTGAFANDNGQSFIVVWWLAAGSNYTSGSLATTWGTRVAANRAIGQVNVTDNTANNFYLTGCQLEVGPVATPFEYRSFADELHRCKRYYQTYSSLTCGYGSANGYARSTHILSPEMRATPSRTVTIVPGEAGSLNSSTGDSKHLEVTWQSLSGVQTGDFDAILDAEL